MDQLIEELKLRIAALESRMNRYELATPAMQSGELPSGEPVNPARQNPFVVNAAEQKRAAHIDVPPEPVKQTEQPELPEVVFRPQGEFSTPEEVAAAAQAQGPSMQPVYWQPTQPKPKEYTTRQVPLPPSPVMQQPPSKPVETPQKQAGPTERWIHEQVPRSTQRFEYTGEMPATRQSAPEHVPEWLTRDGGGVPSVYPPSAPPPPPGHASAREDIDMSQRVSQFAEATVGAIAAMNQRLTEGMRRLEEITRDLEMKGTE